MHEVKSDVLFLPDDVDIEYLSANLSENFKTKFEQSVKGTLTYFDTFDWRLYQKKMLLQYTQDSWELLSLETGDPLSECIAPKPSLKMFAEQFPISRLLSFIEPVLKMRAVLPIITLDSHSTCLRVLNRDKKTVVFIYFEKWSVKNFEADFKTIRIQGVRGYEKHKVQINTFLQQKNVFEQAGLFYPLDKGLELLRRTPCDYSSKFFVPLYREMSSGEASRVIFKKLVSALRQNEQGVYDDIDSEFLHDFRVAIRRTRSGLAQIKSIFPDNITKKFKQDFAFIGQLTGPTRDLDVYLLYEYNYIKRLPDSLKEGLHAFFLDLRRKRRVEFKKMVMELKSSSCQDVISRWDDYLEADEKDIARNSEVSIYLLAQKIIFQRYKKIVKNGKKIQTFSPDEKLHELRIECKKLRYSLEFFRSLFQQNDIIRVLKQLKRLQTNLGDFNDLSVQQEMLQNYLQRLRPGTKKNITLSAAIGGLLTNLSQEQSLIRKKFAAKFHYFSSGKNEALFQKLFK